MIVAAKFNTEERKWFTRLASRSHGKSLWKNIEARWEKFQSCIRWKVGMRDSVRFWEDKWMEGDTLRD